MYSLWGHHPPHPLITLVTAGHTLQCPVGTHGTDLLKVKKEHKIIYNSDQGPWSPTLATMNKQGEKKGQLWRLHMWWESSVCRLVVS